MYLVTREEIDERMPASGPTASKWLDLAEICQSYGYRTDLTMTQLAVMLYHTRSVDDE